MILRNNKAPREDIIVELQKLTGPNTIKRDHSTNMPYLAN